MLEKPEERNWTELEAGERMALVVSLLSWTLPDTSPMSHFILTPIYRRNLTSFTKKPPAWMMSVSVAIHRNGFRKNRDCGVAGT